ncbi:uncharacterized protein LOC130998604 [Salvia miltiorrhiza]|uniref:uncharacterized protein LOC130998604 n=1 Tax=Salvia miltiorrhiza TaxID=226208 RepID=UPI0025ACE5A9|nr:uncharacterized protein LOC130998604 [Salvia miltiorrhiza]
MDHLETSQTKEDEVITHLQKDDQNGYTSHSLILQKKMVDKLVEKIKNKTVDIQTFQGFSRGRLDQVLQSLSPFKRRHHVFFGTTAGSYTPIDIAICDKRITNTKDSVLGAFSGNLYAKQIIAELYLQIAYNLQDAAFSRALTLYQDYKRNDLLTGENRPYSITYQVSYALSNSHHTNLFLGKDFIEIPEICKEVAKAMSPDQVEILQIREKLTSKSETSMC